MSTGQLLQRTISTTGNTMAATMAVFAHLECAHKKVFLCHLVGIENCYDLRHDCRSELQVFHARGKIAAQRRITQEEQMGAKVKRMY